MTSQTTQYPPLQSSDLKDWVFRIARCVHRMMRGKTDNIGSVTLTANATSTTVQETQDRIGINSIVLLMPTTANAAAALSTTYVSARNIASMTFTITHANNSQTDRTFNYTLTG